MATIVMIAGAIGGCSSSPTSAAQCDDRTTTASYVDVQSMSGTVTEIAFATDSSSAPDAEIVHALIRTIDGSPDFTIQFVVSSATAVFERTGSAPPVASNACRLARGEHVELPFSLVTGGFGDMLPGSEPPPPPLVGQMVIVR
jgi:hypothetical protein